MKTLLKLILCVFLLLSFISCKDTSDNKPNATGTSYATLIAYSIKGKHKRSKAYLKLNKIGTASQSVRDTSVHIVKLPKRTQPIMALGDSIKVTYKIYGNEIEISNVNIKTKRYTRKGYFSLK